MSRRWPCVFTGSFIREQVDPRVQQMWQETWGKPARFGEMRRLFRERHCKLVNPYGSDTCPYEEKDCALAFLQAATVSVSHSGTSLGYFRAVCLSGGARRADEKPLARDRESRSDTQDLQPRLGAVSWANGETAAERAMRGRLSRPTRISDLLGASNVRTRDTGVRPDGQEGQGS